MFGNKGKFKCSKCGNCCKTRLISIAYSDMMRWGLKGRTDILNEVRYIASTNNQGIPEGFYFKNQPCIFLKDNKCGIHKTKPLVCKDYPLANDIAPECSSFKKEYIDINQAINKVVIQSNEFKRNINESGNLMIGLQKANSGNNIETENYFNYLYNDPSMNLYVNGYGAESIRGWTLVGTTPYLSAQDQPTNYIYTVLKNATIGNFTFQDPTPSQTFDSTINSVYLYIYDSIAAAYTIRLYTGAGWTSNTVGGNASWGWRSINVTNSFTTWAAITGALMRLQHSNSTSRSNVDAAYLYVDYTLKAVPKQITSKTGYNIAKITKTFIPLQNIKYKISKTLRSLWTLLTSGTVTQAISDFTSNVNLFYISDIVSTTIRQLQNNKFNLSKLFTNKWNIKRNVTKTIRYLQLLKQNTTKSLTGKWKLQSKITTVLRGLYHNRTNVSKQFGILGDGLVAYYKFDETSGTIATDLTSNANNGILYGSPTLPTWEAGKFNNALSFTGVNEVCVTDKSYLKYTGGDYSVSIWANAQTGDNTEGYLVSKAFNGMGIYNYSLVWNTTDKIRVALHGGVEAGFSVTTTDAYSEGEFHHIVMVLKSDKSVLIYVDGVEVVSTSHNITTWTGGAYGDQNVRLAIANLYPQEPPQDYWRFNGLLDELRIYNRALTQSDISSLFANQIKQYNIKSNRSKAFVGLNNIKANISKALRYTQLLKQNTTDNISTSYNKLVNVYRRLTNDTGLVLWWKLDETSGTIATDSSGYGFNGTMTNGTNGTVTWTPSGKFNGAVQFTSTGSSNGALISSPYNTILYLKETESFMAWVKFDSVTGFNPILERVGSNGIIGIYTSGSSYPTGYMGAYSGPNININSSIGCNTIDWYHLAVTCNDGRATMYVNGTIAGSQTTPVFLWADVVNNPWFIGYCWSGDSGANAKIDDARVYNRALRQEEIVNIVNGEMIDHTGYKIMANITKVLRYLQTIKANITKKLSGFNVIMIKLTKSLRLSYNNLARIVRNLILKYNILNNISKQLRYLQLIKSNRITTLKSLYSLKQNITKSLKYLQSIKQNTIKAVSVIWKLGQNTVKSLVSKYNLRSNVTKSIRGLYNSFYRYTINLNIRMNYLLKSNVTKRIISLHKLGSNLSKTIVSLYHNRFNLSKILTNKYGVLSKITDTIKSLYNTQFKITTKLRSTWKLGSLVTTSLRSLYTLRSNLSTTFRSIYHIRYNITDTLRSIWKLSQNTTKALTSKYGSIAKVTQAFRSLYNVLNKYAINLNISSSYVIKSNVSKQLRGLWQVLTALPVTLTIRGNYAIKTNLSKTLRFLSLTKANITNTLKSIYGIKTNITKLFTNKYNILARITKILTYFQHLRVNLTTKITGLYNIKQLLTKSLSFLHNIKTNISTTIRNINLLRANVTKSITSLVGKMYARVVATLRGIWTVFQGGTIIINFVMKTTNKANITSVFRVLHNVRVNITSKFTSLYKSLAKVSIAVRSLFNIRVNLSKNLRYLQNNLAKVIDTLTIKYNVKLLLTKALTSIYNIRFNLSKIIRYTQRNLANITDTLTTKYNSKSLLTSTITSIYNVRANLSKSIRYIQNNLANIMKQLRLQYKFVYIITKVLTSLYNVRARITSNITGINDIRTIISKDITGKYNNLTYVIKRLTLVYKVGFVIIYELLVNLERIVTKNELERDSTSDITRGVGSELVKVAPKSEIERIINKNELLRKIKEILEKELREYSY